MARMSPAAKSASRTLPAQIVSRGPSKKSEQPGVKVPPKSNLGAKIKRTSDIPKGA